MINRIAIEYFVESGKRIMLKKFYFKMIIFFMMAIALLLGFEVLSVSEEYRHFMARITDSEEYITVNTGADEIKPYIEKVKESNGYTKLIIGDSVCHQMFNGLQEYNQEYCIVGSNAAITMAGQYILAELFLENHENVTDIYLLMIPSALGCTFDTQYGYQYTVMPFVETDTLQRLDANTVEQMESVYGKYFMRSDVVWLIDRSGFNRKVYLNQLANNVEIKSEGPVSYASVQYMEKLRILCESRGVKLHFLPGPISNTQRWHDMIENGIREAYEDTVLQEYFPDYLNSVSFYPEEQFRDGIHFGGEYANQQTYNEKIKEMYVEKGMFEGLCFE